MGTWRIKSNEIWNSTGFKIKAARADRKLTVTVNSDSRWTANPHFNGGVRYDVRGAGIMPGSGGYKMQDAEEGVLIGKVGENNNFYFVFKRSKVAVNPRTRTISLTFSIPKELEGEIFFGINDNAQGIGDNLGDIEVLSMK